MRLLAGEPLDAEHPKRQTQRGVVLRVSHVRRARVDQQEAQFHRAGPASTGSFAPFVSKEDLLAIHDIVTVLLQEQAPVEVNHTSANVTLRRIPGNSDDGFGIHDFPCRGASRAGDTCDELGIVVEIYVAVGLVIVRDAVGNFRRGDCEEPPAIRAIGEASHRDVGALLSEGQRVDGESAGRKNQKGLIIDSSRTE